MKGVLYDPLGNCINTTGTVVPSNNQIWTQPQFYDAYGKPLVTYSGDHRSVRQPLQYKGQYGCYTDGHTGLCYCLSRYYDPTSGHWLSRDPAGLEGGVNVYEYCDGNPVMGADPLGLGGDVGAPTGLGGYKHCIPLWGPGRDAIHEFQTGKWGWGLFHSGVAVSDAFLIKSIVVGCVKAAGKVSFRVGAKIIAEEGVGMGARKVLTKAGVAKLTGSVTRSAARSWMGRQGALKAGEIGHHWAIAAGSKIGKMVPNIIKNQPWDYLRIADGSIKGLPALIAHQGLHGVGDVPLSFMERMYYGTPGWAKAAAVSGGGRGIDFIFGRN